jgi:nitrate reductase gamma subunit
MPWFAHLGLMLGYVTMLVLVMGFLHLLQSGPAINWQAHAFGYMATIGLTIGLIYMVRGRSKKIQVQYRRSHSSDWAFLVLLAIIVTTGILQHVFHRTGFLIAANLTYVVHLMAVVPWLLRMPFSKWAHLIYRPLAMYFAGIRKEAFARKVKRTESSEKIRIAA